MPEGIEAFSSTICIPKDLVGDVARRAKLNPIEDEYGLIFTLVIEDLEPPEGYRDGDKVEVNFGSKFYEADVLSVSDSVLKAKVDTQEYEFNKKDVRPYATKATLMVICHQEEKRISALLRVAIDPEVLKKNMFKEVLMTASSLGDAKCREAMKLDVDDKKAVAAAGFPEAIRRLTCATGCTILVQEDTVLFHGDEAGRDLAKWCLPHALAQGEAGGPSKAEVKFLRDAAAAKGLHTLRLSVEEKGALTEDMILKVEADTKTMIFFRDITHGAAFSSGEDVQVMLAVHTQGKATCGIFTRDIAETKSYQVNEYARECEHPLMSDILK